MAMTTGGGGGGAIGDINVTPMIDILLVLLIIFMVIVPVTPKGLDALVPQPPKDPQQQQQPNDRTIVVQVIYRPGAAPAYKINETDVAQGGLAAAADRDLCESRRARHVREGRRRFEFRIHRRRDRYWQSGQRGSHRFDDAEDHGGPVAAGSGVRFKPEFVAGQAERRAFMSDRL